MKRASLIGKIIITGKLILKSPLLIGSGTDDDNDTNDKDIYVIKNLKGDPFIPGTSICGVLREYMTNTNPEMVKYIFGNSETKPQDSKEEILQSSIKFEDIPFENSKITFRDGVKVDDFTGVGVESGKYNYEVVNRGAFGNFCFLVNLRGCHADLDDVDTGEYSLENIKKAIADLMKKLETGINLGALTSKGFGQVKVENIAAGLYDFRNKSDVISWLKQKTPAPKKASIKILPSEIKHTSSPDDFIVEADFVFNSSFIIKDYDMNEKVGDNKISAISLYDKENKKYIVPGTTLKGIFRHQAEYILRKLGYKETVLNSLMGSSDQNNKSKSRFVVFESYISTEDVISTAHTRNRIDRFTGGTVQGMLFTDKPVWQKKSNVPSLKIHFEIHKASDEEAGLALFLIRDLCLGHVAIGGEKSIGRGTLKGISARISYKGKNYELDGQGKVTSGEAADLSKLASLVKNYADKAGEIE